MSDLGAIVKSGAEDMAEAGERAGAAIMKHFEGIGTELENSAIRYRSAESDIERSFTNIARDGTQTAERATSSLGKNAARSVGSTARTLGAQGESEARSLAADSEREAEFTAREQGSGGASDDPIDLVTGEMYLPQRDLSLPGVLPLILERRHGSMYRHGRLFGVTWASTLDQRVQVDEDGIHFAAADGRVLHYPVPSMHGQHVMPSHGPRWPLSWDKREGRDEIRIEQSDAGLALCFPPGPMPEAFRPLAAVVNRAGHRITFVHDDDGVPTDVYHSGGYRLVLESVATRGGVRISAIKLADPRGGPSVLVRDFRYDLAGRLTGVVNASDLPLVFEYDERDRITRWVDRNAFEYGYTYREDGRVARGRGSDGLLNIDLDYDVDARTTTLTDALGNATVYQWNERLQTVKVTDPLGNATATEKDRYGQLTVVTDPLGRTTRIERDRNGDPVRVRWPDGTVLATEYDKHRQPVTVTHPDGALWRYEYNEGGLLAAIGAPAGTQARYQHDERGLVTGYTDPAGKTTAIRCDAAGLPVEVTDPLGGVTRMRRDAFGRVVEVTDPLGAVTTLAWDIDRHPLARTGPDGTRETWLYDAEGNLLEHTDPAGAVTRFEYGPFDKVIARTGPDGSCYTFAYDAQLRLTRVTGPTGLTWTYTYDAAGRLVAERDFNGATQTYTLDAAGQMVSRLDALGQQTRYAYDAVGRCVRKEAGEEEHAFAYDGAGRLLHAHGLGATLDYTRDGLGRVVAETVNGRTVTSAYDVAGRRIERITPGGIVSRWTFDACGQPVALEGSLGAFSFQHDAAGRETVRMLGASSSITRSYDELGRLSNLSVWTLDQPTQSGGGWHAIASRTFSYRADGLPERIDDQVRGPRSYTLDTAGRVTTVEAANWQERYAYDATGNVTHAELLTSEGRQADGEREFQGTLIKRAGRTHYEHDPAGHLIRKTRHTLSGQRLQWTYTWNTDSRLTAVSTPDGQQWAYTYDPLGRRVSKTLLDGEGNPVESTVFTWDGPRLIEQTRTTQAHHTTTTWDHEPGTFIPAAQTRRSWCTDAPQEQIDAAFHAIVIDLAGAPTELVDEHGRVAWHQVRSLWGGVLVTAPDASVDCPLRYPGQYEDAETGLYYNLHRYYDPETGAYASPDPLGLAPAPNPSTYVINPLAWIDPLGLAAYDPTGHADVQNVLAELKHDSGGEDPAVIARLDMDGADPIYGVNGHGQSYARPAGVMPQSMGHAESDAFIQAAKRGLSGGSANMYVAGKIPCGFCRSSLAGWAKHLDLDELNVYSDGEYIGKYVRGGGFKTLNKGTEW